MIASSRRVPLVAMIAAVLCTGTPQHVVAQQGAFDATAEQQEALGATAEQQGALGATASEDEQAPAPVVHTLGDDDQKLFVVDHRGTWSMHAEMLVTDQLLRLWHDVGGPEVTAKSALDRPYTLSVHRLSPERILERLLDGYDYTLHYDGNGHLERVRVYSLDPGSMFKTPRVVESLGRWRELETAVPSSQASSPVEPGPPTPGPESPN